MPKNILIVDDMPAALKSMVAILSNMNFKIITTSNYDQAIVELQQHSFAVAIVDLSLRSDFHVQGLKLIQQIKQKSPKSGIILVTGYPKKLVAQPNVDALFVRGNPSENYPHLKYSLIKDDHTELREVVQNLVERFMEN